MEESGVAYRPDISDDVHSVASQNIFVTDVLGSVGLDMESTGYPVQKHLCVFMRYASCSTEGLTKVEVL